MAAFGVRDRGGRTREQDLPAVRLFQPVENLHQRGLARAVLADEGVNLPLAHGERDTVIRQRTIRVPLRDAAQFQNRRAIHPSPHSVGRP